MRFALVISAALAGCSSGRVPDIVDAAAVDEDQRVEVDSHQQPQDRGGESVTEFSCTNGPDLAVRFLGPETILMAVGERDFVLRRERTASGARYTGDGISFWNKGDEAMFIMPGGDYRCTKRLPKE
ncbi:MAG: MliC family protein [Woeseiaceae bacterium]|nr:MliC family protein [Woeseiaceae bacterium]